MKTILLFTIICLSGCASLSSDSKIIETAKGVKFVSDRQVKMTYKKGDAEYTYDSHAPSLLSRIMSSITIGALGAR